MAKPQVFLSYAREDTETALKLANDLKAAGINLWIDQIAILSGRDWDREVEQALAASDYLLYLVSKSSVESPNVHNEVLYAQDEGKNIVPVIIDDCKIPLLIRSLQYIDLRKDYLRGLKILLKDLNVKTSEISPIDKAKDLSAWQLAEKENTEEAYQRYLEAYPNGNFAYDAFDALEILKKIAAQKEEEAKHSADFRERQKLINRKVGKYFDGPFYYVPVGILSLFGLAVITVMIIDFINPDASDEPSNSYLRDTSINNSLTDLPLDTAHTIKLIEESSSKQ